MSRHKTTDQSNHSSHMSASYPTTATTVNTNGGSSLDSNSRRSHSSRTPNKETGSSRRGGGGGGGGESRSLIKSKVSSPNGGGGVSSGSTSPPNGSTYSSRYYYREMPPRFQSHKYSSNKPSNSKPNKTGSKKSKDTTSSTTSTSSRWPSHSSSSSAPDSWSTSNMDQSIQSNKSTREGGPWTNHYHHRHQSHDSSWPPSSSTNHWTSDEESYSNSDPITEEVLSNEMTDGYHGNSGGGSEGSHKMAGGRQSNEVWDDDYARQKKSLEPTAAGGRDIKSPSNESLDGGADSTVGGEVGGVWRSRNSMGSTSSVNSVGSSSSWKTTNTSSSRMNNYARSTSPRKVGGAGGRYESHRSLSVSSNGGGGGGGGGGGVGRGGNRFSGKKKPVVDLDDAIESLHSEPSGWGELPSPKPTGIDTGTEVWGIPDDVKQKMKKEKGGGGGARGQSWSDAGVDDWGAEDDHGWVENGSESYQQWEASGEGGNNWNTVSSKGGKGRGGTFNEKVRLLVDMGFSPSSCERVLKINNNNIEGALGDLLALTALKEDDQDLGLSSVPPPAPPISLAPPVKSNESGPSPPPLVPPSSSSSHYSSSSSPTPPSLAPSAQLPWQQRQSSVTTPVLTTPTTSSGGGLPSGLDATSLRQVLGQQLNQYLLVRQKLMIQLGQLKSVPSPGGLSPSPAQQQFIVANLNQVNTQIKTVHHQLTVITQFIQHKQLASSTTTSTANISSTNTLPTTTAPAPPAPDEEKELVKGVSGTSGETTPTSVGVDVNYGMQGLSFEDDIRQSTTRNHSRLQKVMTSPENETINDQASTNTNNTGGRGRRGGEEGVFEGSVSQGDGFLQPSINESSTLILPAPTTTAGSLNPAPASVSSSTGFTTSGRFNSVRSVDEIPEFKPGVPWNPQSVGSSKTAPSTPSSDYISSEDKYPSFNRSSGYQSSSSGYASHHLSASSYESKYGGGGGGGPTSSRYSNQPPPIPSSFNRSNSYNGSSASYYGGNSLGGGGASSGYKGFNVGMQQKFLPQQQQQQMQTLQSSSFSRRPKLSHQHSYSGYSSNLPPTPTGNYGNRSSVSGGNYRGSGSYGGQQQNKWAFDGNPWGMPATSGSIWSMESSDSLLNTTASTPSNSFSDWRGGGSTTTGSNIGGRKPSLPLQLTPHNSYIVLRNVTSQIDETSLREVCSEYGKVLTCSLNSFNESVLIRYSTKEEAAMAKSGLERNPSICGVYITPYFASEADISSFSDQRTPSNISLSSAIGMSSSSWLPERLPPSFHHQQQVKKPTSLWGAEPVAGGNAPGDGGQMSLWGNNTSSGGTGLTGLTSPWSSSVLPPTPSQQLPYQQEESNNPGQLSSSSAISSSPPLSTFLPNGLF